MEILLILTGLCIGFILAYAIFHLNKNKSVSKTEYDDLNQKFNDAGTTLRVAEDRLSAKQQEHSTLSTKFDAVEIELMTTKTKAASFETTVQNEQQRHSELAKLLDDQSKQSLTLQTEINALKQINSELTANIKALAENLSEQKGLVTKLQQDAEQLTKKQTTLLTENSKLTAQHALLTESIQTQKESIEKQILQIEQLTQANTQLTAENSKLQANNTSLIEKQATQKEEMLEMQKTSHLQFEKIANQILEEKSGKFTESNKTNIEALLKPLGENIEGFKKKVEETYDKESKHRFSLEEKVKELIEQTNKVSAEANNLATALKGQAKKQGNWGEMILESILQKSGLVKDREYFLQATIKDEEGNNLRPDVLVKLPDNRIIIIDSKVSLVAYDRFSSADTTDEQSIHLVEHLKSIYSHIDSLHDKKYDNLEASLDFTMMFIPIEPAYLISIQTDQDLWAYAYSKRILLISPTNLIACLKLMADLWKREMQSKNAQEIVNRGEKLYEKFVGFAKTMEDIGKGLGKTQEAYNTAVSQLSSGSGNLVGQAMKLKGLGLKSSKELPPSLLPTDFEADEKEREIKNDDQE